MNYGRVVTFFLLSFQVFFPKNFPEALASQAISFTASPRLHVVGSTALYPFATVVAEYMGKKTQRKTPLIEANGTGGGFKIFCGPETKNTPDVVAASRPMDSEEFQQCKIHKKGPLRVFEVGRDGIVLARQKGAAPLELSLDSLFRALAQEVPVQGRWVPNPYVYWSQIHSDLPHERIGILGPPPSSGTYAVLVETILKPFCDRKKSSRCLYMRQDGRYIPLSEQENIIAQKLAFNPIKVGIFSSAFLGFQKKKLTAVPVDGVVPTVQNIQEGRYPLCRTLFFYVREQKLQIRSDVRGFLQSFYEAKASGPQGYLTIKGFIGLKNPRPQGEKVLDPQAPGSML